MAKYRVSWPKSDFFSGLCSVNTGAISKERKQNGDVSAKIQNLKLVCLYAEEKGNPNVFSSFKEFLFNYYAGGRLAIEVCELPLNKIKDNLIICLHRTKYDKRVFIIIDKVA